MFRWTVPGSSSPSWPWRSGACGRCVSSARESERADAWERSVTQGADDTRKRFVLQGTAKDVDVWGSLLRHDAIALKTVESVDGALAGDASMVIVFARPEDAASLGLAAAAKEGVPPLALLLKESDGE